MFKGLGIDFREKKNKKGLTRITQLVNQENWICVYGLLTCKLVICNFKEQSLKTKGYDLTCLEHSQTC